MRTDSVIETQGLTKRYGDVEALVSLSLGVRPQSVTGFLGRNGAGKSTTIKMLLGMIRPTTGTGQVLGHAIDDASRACCFAAAGLAQIVALSVIPVILIPSLSRLVNHS
jgi:ABC-2 type transport system ATP-binding protein